MHDQSVMNALMARIRALAEANRARRVTAVRVRLGALSHMSPAHFREHFEQAARGSIAEGAMVEAEETQELHDVFLVDVELEM
ncbi:MAG: hydrogenase maturation nickel metallochaperone HypA [Burkholderiales bacterium]|nr:hydrogenase maturation nickel metallochaperone HypA [Burkholderiales bacterium]